MLAHRLVKTMNNSSNIEFNALKSEILNCQLCKEHLPMGPNPVVQIDPRARILIAGQAPGRIVHETGIPFNDASGNRLREWMGIDKSAFYDAKQIAIVPMGFCFPGTGKSGDLPPRKECADKWRQSVLSHLSDIQLTLVIGQYAMKWHLGKEMEKTLTATVRNWQSYSDSIFPLPHPSPRNYGWLKKNPWFEKDILPSLKNKVNVALDPVV